MTMTAQGTPEPSGRAPRRSKKIGVPDLSMYPIEVLAEEISNRPGFSSIVAYCHHDHLKEGFFPWSVNASGPLPIQIALNDMATRYLDIEVQKSARRD